jgi:hypothetical protein
VDTTCTWREEEEGRKEERKRRERRGREILCEEGKIETRGGGEMRVDEEEVSALSTIHIT